MTKTVSEFREYMRLLRDLHALIAAGRSESPDADLLRDQMDAPWTNLSTEEVARIRGLSADLYESSAHPSKPIEALTSRNDIRRIQDTDVACKSGNWDRALILLREISPFMPAHQVAYLRARCWLGMDVPENTVLFLQSAIKHEPRNVNYLWLLLDVLIRNDRIDEARKISDPIIEHEAASHPHLLLKAADVKFFEARRKQPAAAADQYREIVSLLDRTLPKAFLLPDNEQKSSLIIAGLVEKGMCHEHLNELDDALDAYNQALSIDRVNEAALIARGILRYGIDTRLAIRDFRAASAFSTSVVWPYFYLAHYALLNRQIEECIAYCTDGLSRQSSDSVRASLFEWLAIAQHMSGVAEGEVRRNFALALQILPDDPRIRQDLKNFEESIVHQRGANWIPLISESDVRQIGLSQHAA